MVKLKKIFFFNINISFGHSSTGDSGHGLAARDSKKRDLYLDRKEASSASKRLAVKSDDMRTGNSVTNLLAVSRHLSS